MQSGCPDSGECWWDERDEKGDEDSWEEEREYDEFGDVDGEDEEKDGAKEKREDSLWGDMDPDCGDPWAESDEYDWRREAEKAEEEYETTRNRPDPPIVLCAVRGDLRGVECCLGDSVDIESCGMWTETGLKWGTWEKEWTWKKDTALVASCRFGHPQVTAFLLERGANIDHESCLTEDVHDTAISIAKQKGHAECVRLLETAIFNRKKQECGKIVEQFFTEQRPPNTQTNSVRTSKRLKTEEHHADCHRNSSSSSSNVTTSLQEPSAIAKQGDSIDSQPPPQTFVADASSGRGLSFFAKMHLSGPPVLPPPSTPLKLEEPPPRAGLQTESHEGHPSDPHSEADEAPPEGVHLERTEAAMTKTVVSQQQQQEEEKENIELSIPSQPRVLVASGFLLPSDCCFYTEEIRKAFSDKTGSRVEVEAFDFDPPQMIGHLVSGRFSCCVFVGLGTLVFDDEDVMEEVCHPDLRRVLCPWVAAGGVLVFAMAGGLSEIWKKWFDLPWRCVQVGGSYVIRNDGCAMLASDVLAALPLETRFKTSAFQGVAQQHQLFSVIRSTGLYSGFLGPRGPHPFCAAAVAPFGRGLVGVFGDQNGEEATIDALVGIVLRHRPPPSEEPLLRHRPPPSEEPLLRHRPPPSEEPMSHSAAPSAAAAGGLTETAARNAVSGSICVRQSVSAENDSGLEPASKRGREKRRREEGGRQKGVSDMQIAEKKEESSSESDSSSHTSESEESFSVSLRAWSLSGRSLWVRQRPLGRAVEYNSDSSLIRAVDALIEFAEMCREGRGVEGDRSSGGLWLLPPRFFEFGGVETFFVVTPRASGLFEGTFEVGLGRFEEIAGKIRKLSGTDGEEAAAGGSRGECSLSIDESVFVSMMEFWRIQREKREEKKNRLEEQRHRREEEMAKKRREDQERVWAQRQKEEARRWEEEIRQRQERKKKIEEEFKETREREVARCRGLRRGPHHLYKLPTGICTNTNCHSRDFCTFAHTGAGNESETLLPHCRHFAVSGTCRFGNLCLFNHLPPRFKNFSKEDLGRF
uniref:C3H1-type domain-containing protein n=1 Tax=Chromera velia CCMP2878 TaxID=1169474 RepID=A0A0G4H1Q4_9ALVE|eukprot:Cvel_24353.t1-p1 / transcript=Cvel_24353.t1 / gene=Cvel_24353 / organism=Chromera_velia_CCMP2878 / gene_product=hypothetical protein / transcript_product=hypothetical protein / location=Cvel_scaffold2619:12339-16063(-) / protein_length=1032 / sequence_SO=supercontig / SO=protein_coding / is_pseudo=false